MNSESDEQSSIENGRSKRIKITHDMQCASSSAATLVSELLPFNFLPFELNTEILLRIPVKYLSRYKCVSKSWRSFISRSQFAKAHLAAASDNDECEHHKLLFTILPPNASLKECSLRSALSEATTEVFEVNYLMKRPRKSVWVVGYCRGLVCYAIQEKHLFLLNPSTGKSNKLPDLNVKLKNGCFLLYGFGYDERNDDYKVVVIFCVFSSASVHETEVMVYSLNTNYWRRIQDFKGGIPLDDSGKYVNGKLHWAASVSYASAGGGSSYEWKIVGLDLADESYEEINGPDSGENTNDWTFGVVNGCLCVLYNYLGTRADLWVMKEYGSQESWTKMVSIPYMNSPHNCTYSMPLCMLKNSELLLLYGSSLVVYNPKHSSLRYLQFNNLVNFFEVGLYVESFISPSICGTGIQQK